MNMNTIQYHGKYKIAIIAKLHMVLPSHIIFVSLLKPYYGNALFFCTFTIAVQYYFSTLDYHGVYIYTI